MEMTFRRRQSVLALPQSLPNAPAGSENRQAVVAELGLRALAADDVQAVMAEAADRVREGLGVGFAYVAELLPGDGAELAVRAGVGLASDDCAGEGRLLARGSLAEHCLALGEPVACEDLLGDERFDASAEPFDRQPVSGGAVVVGLSEEPFGALAAFSGEPRAFSEGDVSFLQAVANVLATVVERGLAQQRLDEAREAERSRIARDLHDRALGELSHALALAQAQSSAHPEAAGEASEVVSLLKRVAEEVRAAVYDLRLGDHEDRTFRELLEGLVALHQGVVDDGSIELEVGDGVLRGRLGDRGTEFLRILGEALTNVGRHASASRVRVDVSVSRESLTAEVTDDGVGFDLEHLPSPARQGLRGMRERAKLIGGNLGLESTPGAGTTVHVEMPLRSGAEPAESVRVLLVEDHAAIREAIAAAFEHEPGFTVVAQAGSLARARESLDGVDVAVVDLGLPDGFGADLIEELRRLNPAAQALVLSATSDRAGVARAVQSGAAGVLDKAVHLDEVVDAVRRLRGGETLLPLQEVVELLRYAGRRRELEHDDRARIAALTRREREVLQALADGLDREQIADRLFITVRTTRNHVANILAKLGVHSQLQAVVFALRYDVVEIRNPEARWGN
jgi:DNA-binding NarL/FixJ family response regulator/signal transduction histidine kinase